MKKTILGLALAALLSAPAMAQGVSEANGTVVDREGNSIQGAVVTIRAKSNPETAYSATTNKKGRFFIAGMFSAIEDERWLITCEAEGYMAVKVNVESRTVNKVLVGDPWTAVLKPKSSPPEIPIRPLGFAKLDWTVARTEDVEADLQAQQALAAEAAQAAGGEGESAQAAVPQKDPWVEALTLASAGSLEDSVEFFQKAIDDDPENAERHETFAKILYRLERHDEAEAEARRSVEIDPSRVESQILLFNVYDKRGDLDQARATLEAAEAASPTDTRVLMRLGYVAKLSGDNAGAIEAYRKVTEVDADNAEAWLALANLYSDTGEFDASAAAYERVVQIDPAGAHQTYYNLGATIIKRGNSSEPEMRRAIDAFRRALEIQPDYARAAQELAIALITVGDKAGARAALESFVSGNPKAPESTQMKALIQSLQ